MVSGDGDVCDSDLAFMASAEFDPVDWDVLDHHHAFGFLAGGLKNEVVSFWFGDWKELAFFAFDVDYHWKFGFADLTFKLFEIIMNCSANDVLFDFDLDPVEETFQMDCSAGTSAFARPE